MWLSYLLRIRHSGRIGKPYEKAGPPLVHGKSGLFGGYVPRACLLKMLVGNVPYRRVRRPVMRVWLVVSARLRTGVMRPRMVVRSRRRRRGRRVMGSGFGFRGSENGGNGNCTEDGGEAKQEGTAAEARGFGTLHNDLLWYGVFSCIGFPMNLTLLYQYF